MIYLYSTVDIMRVGNNEASQIACSMLIVTNKNHTKEGLTNNKFAEELHKLLNQICINLKNNPDCFQKNGFPLKKTDREAKNILQNIHDRNRIITNFPFPLGLQEQTLTYLSTILTSNHFQDVAVSW